MHFLFLVFSLFSLALNSSSPDNSCQGTEVFLDLSFWSWSGDCHLDAQGNFSPNGATQTYRVEFLGEIGNNSISVSNMFLTFPKCRSSNCPSATFSAPYIQNGLVFIDFVGCGEPTLTIEALVYGQNRSFTSNPIILTDYCC